ncbi:unnamed protein product [Ixodes hexagonus]
MNIWKAVVWIWFTVCHHWGHVLSIEVVLDSGDATGAFFLSTPEDSGPGVGPEEVSRRFALTLSNRMTVLARFGPFSVRQTVYASGNPVGGGTSHNVSGDGGPPPEVMGDVTAHLVTAAPRRDRPTLRMLFHTGSEVGAPPVCVALYAQHLQEHLMSVCSPNRDGACLAELTLPASWWPPLWAQAQKSQRPSVALRYALLRGPSLECQGHSLRVSGPLAASGTPLGRLSLSPVHGSYEEVSGDGVVCLLVPQGPVYPRAKVYVPVLVRPNPAYPFSSFLIRARVKPGLRILQVQPTAKKAWSIAVDTNSKHTSATVTVTKVDEETALPESGEEVFNWLFEVEEGVAHEDGGQVSWQLRYLGNVGTASTTGEGSAEDSVKMTSRLDIQKDDVQAVLLVAKSSQLLNTAVLTGKQVSQPMKVFVVSQSGLLGDVTLQSSCHSADESILKVSPSCTSVYLDGSEVRGSQNATVLVKYGTYTGQTHFLVWMPELPLELRLSDTKLSQVRGWRSPHKHKRCRSSLLQRDMDCRSNWLRNKRRIIDKWDEVCTEGVACRLRFQQARAEVYTRFLSVDHNSGREAYLLGRRTQVSVTHLVAPFVRVADPHVAALQDTVVRGMRAGRTEVQVLSPITGKVLGAAELRVSTDKESISQLDVHVVTGLSLAVIPDEATPGVFLAKTSTSHSLTSLYQEGLLDMTLRFSDGTSTPLTDVAESDFSLTTESLDPSVVALAPVAPSSGGRAARPRVVAVGQGQGNLLQVHLELGEACQRKRRGSPLAWSRGRVDSRFPATVGGGGREGLDSVPYQDGVRPHEPTVQAHQNRAALSADGTRVLVASPLELGLYALLGVLGLAAAVMVAGCTVLAVKYQKQGTVGGAVAAVPPPPPPQPRRPVASAHDWVWLGRATLERSSVNTRCSQALVPPEDRSKTTIVHLPHAHPPPPATTATTNTAAVTATVTVVAPDDPKRPQPRIRTNPMLTFTRPPPVPPHRAGKTTPVGSKTPSPNARATAEMPVVKVVSLNAKIPSPNAKVPSPNAKVPSPNAKTTAPSPHQRVAPAHPKSVSPGSKVTGKVKGGAKGSAAGANTLEWEDVTKGMNYDQLVEYFDSLKESSA